MFSALVLLGTRESEEGKEGTFGKKVGNFYRFPTQKWPFFAPETYLRAGASYNLMYKVN